MSYVETWAEWANRSESSKYSEAIHPSGANKRDWFISGYLSAVDIYALMGLPFEKSILEYGCGNGRILTHFKNHESYGVDITPQFVNEAKELGLQAFLLDEFNKKVDIVYSSTVFIHLNVERTKEALKYIYDHLKLGGRAYLQIYIFKTIRRGDKFIDVNCLDLPTYQNLVREVGFKEVKTESHDFDWDWNRLDKHKPSIQILEKI